MESSEERSGRVWPSVMATTRRALFASLSRAGEAAGCVERSVGADWCVIAEGGFKESVEGTAIALREAESQIKRTSDREGNGLDRETRAARWGGGEGAKGQMHRREEAASCGAHDKECAELDGQEGLEERSGPSGFAHSLLYLPSGALSSTSLPSVHSLLPLSFPPAPLLAARAISSGVQLCRCAAREGG